MSRRSRRAGFTPPPLSSLSTTAGTKRPAATTTPPNLSPRCGGRTQDSLVGGGLAVVAIDVHDQLRFQAGEVGKVGAGGNLPSKFESVGHARTGVR